MTNTTSNKIPISVIIPVANRLLNNLDKCLESILAQTMKDIEIIIVKMGTDETLSSICKCYSDRDSRIKVLSKSDKCFGAAFNAGLEEAKGDYVSFANPCDWLEPEMFAELYKIAADQDIDVVHCLAYKNSGSRPKVSNPFANANREHVNFKSDYKFYVPKLLHFGTDLYSTIYRKNFLTDNQIKFSEIPGSYAQNLGFTFLVFCCLGSFFIHEAALYHLNIKDRQKYNRFTEAINSVGEYQYIKDLIGKMELDGRCVGKRYLHLGMAKVFRQIVLEYSQHCKTIGQKTALLKTVEPILKDYNQFKNKNMFLMGREKRLYGRLLTHPVKTPLTDFLKRLFILLKTDISFHSKKKQIRILGLRLFFYKKNVRYFTFNIMYIPIIRIKTSRDNIKSISTKENFILGVPALKTISPIDYLHSLWRTKQLAKAVGGETNGVTAGELEEIKKVHSIIFPHFKDSNIGKTLVIIGNGATLECAPLFKGCKVISCNKNPSLFGHAAEYIFNSEYRDNHFEDLLISNDTSDIFLDCVSLNIKKHLYNHARLQRKKNTHYYFGQSVFNVAPKGNISENPLSYFGDTACSALHFALYTKPKAIYLIGCDIKGRYSKNSFQKYNASDAEIIYGYEQLKRLRDREFSDTKIVCVNPVGLKGIFDELYSNKYIAQKAIHGIRGIDSIDEHSKDAEAIRPINNSNALIASYNQETRRGTYLFDVPIPHKPAKNVQKTVTGRDIDKYLSTLHVDYDDAYLLHGGSGEIFMFIAYQAERLMLKNKSKKPVFICAEYRSNLVYLAELFGYKCVVGGDNIFPVRSKNYKHFDGKSDSFEGHRYFKAPFYKPNGLANKTINYYKPVSATNYYNILYKYNDTDNDSLNSEGNGVKAAVPRISEQIVMSLRAKISNIKLNMDKFIVIDSGANYFCTIPQGFWQSLANKIIDKGFDIFQNFRDGNTYIEGCKYADLSYSEIFALAQRAKAIISLRSGLGEILLHTKTPHIVIYSGDRFLNYSRIDSAAYYWSFKHDPISKDVKLSEIPYYNFETNDMAVDKALSEFDAMTADV